MRGGSSPLARGLREESLRGAHLRRIIPARAGFTSRSVKIERLWRDHPRSRGVYAIRTILSLSSSGSSPLARGLRCPSRRMTRSTRIIPARAGFTNTAGSIMKWVTDHPRSRGVYASRNARRRISSGSSPLARGLRGNILGAVTQGGIIPARAGFTFPDLSGRPECQDHPRSRGVYRSRGKFRLAFRGSSPLARGLRPLDNHVKTVFGSSPLARGLHIRPVLIPALGRIIPARAGFTKIFQLH